jgi:outer membrane autotransporter protein
VFTQGKSTGNAINGNFGTIQGDLTINGGDFIQAGTLGGDASVAAGGTLIFGGRLNNVNSDGNLSKNLRTELATFSNDGAVVFDGQSSLTVVLGRISGTGTVENRGGGLNGGVTFDAPQHYTGKTMVTGGFLSFNEGYASSLFEVSGGATVRFNNDIGTTTTFTRAVTGAGNFMKGGTGTMTVASVLANTGAVVGGGGTLEFGPNGGMAQTAVLGTEYGGKVDLAARDFTVGGLRGQSGEIEGTGKITINSAANTINQYSGVISGAGRSIVKTGAGLQEFYGVNTYDGGTTVQAGILKVGSSAALGAGGVTVETGANLELGTIGNFAGADFIFDKVITGAGGLIKTSSNTVTLSGVNTYTGVTWVKQGTLRLSDTGKIALASTIKVESGAKFDIGAASFTTNTFSNITGDLVGGGGTLTLNFSDAQTYSGKISDGLGANDKFRLAITGGGNITLNGDNSFTGGITIGGHGTKLILGHNNAAGGANNTILTQGTVITYLNGVNSPTAITIGSNTTQLEVNGTDSAQQSGLIGEDQAGRPLEKIGTGTLILGNGMANPQNTFSGAFTISAGTVAIRSDRNLGSDTATNRLVLNGGTLDAGSNNVGNSRPLSVGASGGTVNASQLLVFQSNDNVFTGQLTKTGSGTLVFTGQGTGAGGIRVDAGVLSLARNTSAGTGTLTLGANTTLRGRTTGIDIANNIALDGTGVRIERDFAGVNYTLSGVISGTGSLLKPQDGTIDLTGNNTFTGGVTLSAGTLGVGSNTALGTAAMSAQIGTTLRAVAGNLNVGNNIVITQGMVASNQFTVDTNGFNMTLSGVISTNVPVNELVQPGLTKDGAGNLTLSGVNTYRGATIVNAGKLIVNGSIANTSSVTIADGAVLGGNAAIPNLNVLNGARLSPGNSIGVVNIAGNLTLNAGSTTVIEIQQAQSDRIIAGGTAAIAGTLQLVALGGPYVFSSPYTIITATGGRTGTFATVNTDTAFGVGVTSTVLYGANTVQVVLNAAPLTQAISPLLTRPRNVLAVASGMDRALANGADPSAFFNVYNQPTREALAAAVNSLSGEVHTGANAMGVKASDQFMRVMLDPFALGRDASLMNTAGGGFGDAAFASNRGAGETIRSGSGPEAFIAQAPLQARRFAVWGAAYGQTARGDADRLNVGSSRLSASDGHLAIGADMGIAPGIIAGVAFSGGQGDASLANGMGSAKADIYQAGLYAMGRFGALSFGATASYGSLQVETSRSIPVLGLGVVKADYRAESWSGRLEAAYALSRLAGFGVSPTAALQAQSVRTPSFIETSGGTGLPAGVVSRATTNATVRSELGLKLDYVAQVAGTDVNIYVSAAWGHYFARDAKFSGSLIGLAGAGFTVEGVRPSRDVALIAAGADMKIGPNMHLGARFDTEQGSGNRSYAGSAKLRMAF